MLAVKELALSDMRHSFSKVVFSCAANQIQFVLLTIGRVFERCVGSLDLLFFRFSSFEVKFAKLEMHDLLYGDVPNDEQQL